MITRFLGAMARVVGYTIVTFLFQMKKRSGFVSSLDGLRLDNRQYLERDR
ncbi:hypothetical protein RB213_010892 [Colletotrichum asianum]